MEPTMSPSAQPPMQPYLPSPQDITNKYIKSISQAGQWARVLGWLLVGLLPFNGLFTSTHHDPVPIILYVVAVPLAFYLIWGGKYVQNIAGRKVGTFLLLNIVASLLFIAGLIPLITIILSSIAFNRWRKLQQSNVALMFHPDKASPSVLEIVIFVLAALAGFMLLGISFAFVGGATTPHNSPEVNKVLKNGTGYTSVEHSFKVDFPDFPTTEHESLTVEGFQVPYTIYSTGDDKVAHLVSVFDYSAFTGEFDNKAGLEGGVNGMVQNKAGSKLISSDFTTFKGYDAINAHLTIPDGGIVYDAYMTGIVRNKKMYVLLTIGISKSAHDSFANSFTFTQ